VLLVPLIGVWSLVVAGIVCTPSVATWEGCLVVSQGLHIALLIIEALCAAGGKGLLLWLRLVVGMAGQGGKVAINIAWVSGLCASEGLCIRSRLV
jgi:hypothetical protein